MTLTYVSALAGLLLVLIPAYLLYLYDRPALQKAAVATVRMVVQLSVMGACLWAVYSFDRLWLSLLWVVVLVLAATFLMVSRVRSSDASMLQEGRKNMGSSMLFMPVGAAMLVAVLVFSAYVLYAVLRPAAPLSARWLVPVSGVLVAHVMTTGMQGLRTFFDCLQQDSQPYSTLIGNGATRMQALAPYITRALRALMKPAIANMSAMGLFVMPMLLSGLLLGGLSVVEAVVSYVTLALAGVAASVVALLLALALLCRHSQFPMR